MSGMAAGQTSAVWIDGRHSPLDHGAVAVAVLDCGQHREIFIAVAQYRHDHDSSNPAIRVAQMQPAASGCEGWLVGRIHGASDLDLIPFRSPAHSGPTRVVSGALVHPATQLQQQREVATLRLRYVPRSTQCNGQQLAQVVHAAALLEAGRRESERGWVDPHSPCSTRPVPTLCFVAG